MALTTVNGTLFMVCDYLSQNWMENFLLKGQLFQGTRASVFDDYDIEELMEQNSIKVFNTVKAGGGWTGIGWTKLGKVQDKATDQAATNTYNAAQPILGCTGTIVHHLLSLVPSKP